MDESWRRLVHCHVLVVVHVVLNISLNVVSDEVLGWGLIVGRVLLGI